MGDSLSSGAESGGLDHVSPVRIRPVRLALYYVLAGFIWMAISSRVLALIPPNSQLPRWMVSSGPMLALMPPRTQMLNLWVNALGLYLVAAFYTKRIRVSVAAQEEAMVRARGYFESSVEGIISVDSAGIIRQLNPRGQELFGYREAEVAGQPIEVLVPQRFNYRHEAHRSGYFTAPKSRLMGRGMEVAGRRKDGSEFPAEISLNVVQTHRGKLVIAFVADISERVGMEREARRNETVDALAAVAAGVAHELNNPLAVMAARIELMLAVDQDLSTQTRDDLMVLEKNIERASRISHNLLSIARQRPGARYAMDMNVAVEEAMLIVGAEAKGGVFRYETKLDRSLPEVMGEPTGLEQVLINLILNARDAGAHLIRIETAPAPGRAGHLQLSVSDDGPGINSDALGKLFQPFFTTKPKGTGLGLWLSQRIVRDHGGSIAVESAVDKGATFTITLPTIGESSAGHAAHPARDEAPAPPQVSAARSDRPAR
ncbi:two-component system sensor histidine kinase NtrB [Candidatus Binatus soli]|jgi:PAS domain S-box-containing protein|uniref:two-component system sensor histidine kinase NtrB n=1 Tax=Candidatus Binatus soli TaxID=1953413 RepID=UPI003D14C6BC